MLTQARNRRVPAALGLMLLLCTLMGMFIGLGSTQLNLLAVGGALGLCLLFVPTGWVLTALLALSFVLVGIATYYFRVNQAVWVPYALCMFLWLKLPLDRLSPHARLVGNAHPTPPFVLTLYLYFVICGVSALFNQTPLINVLVGAKNYIFVWIVAFLVGSAATTQQYLRGAWLSVLWLAILQTPFTISQHLQSRLRIGGSSPRWDAVVGTFGGDPEGGGASGAMAIFLVIAIGTAAAFLKRRAAPPLLCWAAIVGSLVSIAMAEVKVVFALIPLVLAVVLARDLRARPLTALSLAGVVVLSLGMVAYFYSESYYKPVQSVKGRGGISAYYEYLAGLDANPDFVNLRTGEVSRLGAPLLWLHQADRIKGGSHVFGFGMTASRASQTVGYGAAARQLPFALTTSALTVLLWEVGAAGALAFIATLCLAGFSAWRMARRTDVSFDRAALEATAAAFCVALPSLLYNDALVNAPSLQILYAFLLGFVLHHYRKSAKTGLRGR